MMLQGILKVLKTCVRTQVSIIKNNFQNTPDLSLELEEGRWFRVATGIMR
jgi:hypothetical protein